MNNVPVDRRNHVRADDNNSIIPVYYKAMLAPDSTFAIVPSHEVRSYLARGYQLP